MSASPEPAVDMLSACRNHLRILADEHHEQLVPRDAQLLAEHAVAVGIAELAGEDRPDLPDLAPSRPIMAKDLLITVDLVLRALSSGSV